MKRVLTNIVLLLLVFSVYSQTGIPKAQAMFIYNFSRLIEWPVNSRSGSFIIGILGSSTVADELKGYTAGKKVGTQDIQIILYKTVQEISTCHILFVPFGKTKQLSEIQSTLQDRNTLLISEKNGALNEGSAINFIILTDKIKFEIRTENITKYGLKYSSKLQEMANSNS
jgi:hypothetical protein